MADTEPKVKALSPLWAIVALVTAFAVLALVIVLGA